MRLKRNSHGYASSGSISARVRECGAGGSINSDINSINEKRYMRPLVSHSRLKEDSYSQVTRDHYSDKHAFGSSFFKGHYVDGPATLELPGISDNMSQRSGLHKSSASMMSCRSTASLQNRHGELVVPKVITNLFNKETQRRLKLTPRSERGNKS